MTTSPARTDRWKALDFGPPPSGLAEPDQAVLVEYLSRERVAVIVSVGSDLRQRQDMTRLCHRLQ